MEMNHDEHMFKLFLTSQKKCQDACDAFEGRFAWLAETLEAARRTFASEELSLLPKTPRGRKKAKKLPPVVIIEDSPDQVAKRRSSVSNNGDQEEEEEKIDITTPPRRRPTRMAKEKTKNYIDYKINRKMRQPSVSEQATAVKIRGGTRKAIKKRSQENVRKTSSDKRSRSSSRDRQLEKQEEAHTDPQPSSSDPITVSPQHATPKKDSQGSRRLSVNLNRERLSADNTSQDSAAQVTFASTRVSPVIVASTSVSPVIVASTRVSGNACPVVVARTDDSHSTSQVTDAETESSRDTTQVTIAKARDEESSDGDSSHLALRLEDSEDCKSDGESEAQRPQDGVECNKEVKKDSPIASSSEARIAALSLEVQDMDEDGDDDEVVPSSPPKPVPRARKTRTKQKAPQPVQPLIDTTDSDEEEEPAVQPVAKPRSTRTKQKVTATQDTSDSQMLPPTDVPKTRVTRTKVKAKEISTSSEPEMASDSAEMSDDRCKSKSVSAIEVPKARSTRTKKKAMEVELVDISDGPQVETLPQKPRSSTRTKKRPVEEPLEEQPTVSSVMKRRKTDEGSEPEKSGEHNQAQSSECDHKLGSSPATREGRHTSSQDSASSSGVSSAKSATLTESEDVEKTLTPPQEPVRRMTRSKMRQAQPIRTSPVKASPQSQSPWTPNQEKFNRKCCTPKDSESPKSPVLYQLGHASWSRNKYSPRPFSKSCVRGKEGAPHQHTAVGAIGEVEDLTIEMVEVAHSPSRVTRHSPSKGAKGEDRQKRGGASKAQSSPQTTEKRGPGWSGLLSSTYGSSGRITPKTFSRLHLGLNTSSSSEYKTYRKFGTPSEGRRPANMLSGVNSFIKVQSAKPTREDMEQKRQQELQRKREKAEEMGKKKEELMKAKADEKKRANEERMRRVQEAREERERKAREAKEQQERERHQREERQKEEQQRRKQQVLAKKKAEEEARALRIKEQQEEEERKRKEEEKRKQMEEEKRLKEVRKQEEERRAQLIEQKRIQEEERRAQLIEQRRVQEEERRRKVTEVERIAREKRELERLKQQEAQRKAASPGKKSDLNTSNGDDKENHTSAHDSTYTTTAHNSTYTAHNSTYTAEKPAVERSDSYEITPNKKTKRDKSTGNDYNINNIKSDDSTDNDGSPKKKVPAWAMSSQLNKALIKQEYYPPVIEKIFIPEELLLEPNLREMFTIQRRRFYTRSSSAIWNTPPSKMFQTG